MADEKITVGTLEQLRVFTFRQGIVADEQIVHLKLWLLAVATHIEPKHLSIEIDTEKYHVKYLFSYSVKKGKGKKAQPPKGFVKSCGSVAVWVQWLFGGHWSVEFIQNKKQILSVSASAAVPVDLAKSLRVIADKESPQLGFGKVYEVEEDDDF